MMLHLALDLSENNKLSGLSVFPAYSFTRQVLFENIILFVLSGVLTLILYLLIKKNHKRKLEKQRIEFLEKEEQALLLQNAKHRQELLTQEHIKLQRESEMLKTQIRDKTIELAKKAKEDEDKNRLLHQLKEIIEEAEKNPSVSTNKLKEMRRLLTTYLEIEDHTFEIQMDELHQEFFKSIKSQYSNLSIYDLRLCAYLRLGLNSREMADILQVLPSSINVSRSRLRKKLGLLPEDDLYKFLSQF